MNHRTRTSSPGRRRFLRGMGAALALPWMESIGQVGRAGRLAAKTLDRPPVRSAFLFFPNGVVPDHWHASNPETFTDSPMLRALTPHKEELVLLKNLWHEQTVGRNGHWAKVPAWLAGGYVERGQGGDIDTGGTSIDQLMAREIGSRSVLPSLELGTEPPRTGIDNVGGGFPRMVGSYISWRDPHTPVAKEIVPRLAFDRLFRTGLTLPPVPGMATDSKRAQVMLQRDDGSILDLVLDDAKSLQRRISGADKTKLDEYLESVRAVERRIEANIEPPARWVNEKKLDVLRPGMAIPGSHEEYVRIMLDIMVLAFWTDSTRISTFMLADAQSGRKYDFLPGVRKKSWHGLSHHREDLTTRGEYERIATWHVEQLAYLLDRMKNLDEGGSSLLDNSQIMFGTSISDGNSHNEHDLPLVLAGKAGGRIRTGRRLDSEKDTPMCNLLLRMAQNVGVTAESFGDSTGALNLS
ncbi:MAG: DUF1552 domain-containing protein [Verrucomicrobiota bacterium]